MGIITEGINIGKRGYTDNHILNHRKHHQEMEYKRLTILKELSESGKNTLTRHVIVEKHKKHSTEFDIIKRKQMIKNTLKKYVHKLNEGEIDVFYWPTSQENTKYVSVEESNNKENFVAICELF